MQCTRYESQSFYIHLLITVCTWSRYCAVHTIAAKPILYTSDENGSALGYRYKFRQGSPESSEKTIKVETYKLNSYSINIGLTNEWLATSRHSTNAQLLFRNYQGYK